MSNVGSDLDLNCLQRLSADDTRNKGLRISIIEKIASKRYGQSANREEPNQTTPESVWSGSTPSIQVSHYYENPLTRDEVLSIRNAIKTQSGNEKQRRIRAACSSLSRAACSSLSSLIWVCITNHCHKLCTSHLYCLPPRAGE